MLPIRPLAFFFSFFFSLSRRCELSAIFGRREPRKEKRSVDKNGFLSFETKLELDGRVLGLIRVVFILNLDEIDILILQFSFRK